MNNSTFKIELKPIISRFINKKLVNTDLKRPVSRWINKYALK